VAVTVTSGGILGIRLRFHHQTPKQAAVLLAFPHRQPINLGATTSAGREKKAWGKAGKSLVMDWMAMGVTGSQENNEGFGVFKVFKVN